MPRITMKQDNLNERNREFVQAPLEQPVFLNSVPKCGTHLIRNIMRMFVPVEQQYHDTFLQIPNLRGHMRALSPEAPKISWGHMLFSDDSAMAISPATSFSCATRIAGFSPGPVSSCPKISMAALAICAATSWSPKS